MDNATELQALYAGVLAVAHNYVGTPPPHAIFNPAGWLSDWIRGHPQEAQALASDTYYLLHQFFVSRGR